MSFSTECIHQHSNITISFFLFTFSLLLPKSRFLLGNLRLNIMIGKCIHGHLFEIALNLLLESVVIILIEQCFELSDSGLITR